MNLPVRVMIFSMDADRTAAIASPLEALGYAVSQHQQPTIAGEILRRERPNLAIIVTTGTSPAGAFLTLQDVARKSSLPTLVVTDRLDGVNDLLTGCDDWLTVANLETELATRTQRLINRPTEAKAPAIDPRFLALVVHDLRTPLNVINLTIRAIGQSVPNPTADFEEDLSFLQENSKQMEKMLAQLGDYCRLVESEQRPAAVEFETRRFLTDFLEEKQSKRDSEFKMVRLEVAADTPSEVALDPNRVRLAITHMLANAVAAAGEASIKLRSRGTSDHWILDVVIEKAPPPTITATQLHSHVFERMIGSPAERRGLDLAIAARVSELFGGTARLDVESGLRSVISLEWPARLAP